MRKLFMGIVFGVFALGVQGMAVAGERGTADEAVAMVKKAIAFMKANGREKAYAEINNPNGQFKDRDLYVVVYDLKAKNIAHGANPRMIGKDLIEMKDADGKAFMKERVEIMKAKDKGWQDYKFLNPVTKKIEPKSMYLEKFEDVIVACGIYKE